MKHLTINQIDELQGRMSKDEWGNKTRIRIVEESIVVDFVDSDGFYYKKIPFAKDNLISTINGAREMLIKDLQMVGFDVVFKGTPYLTREQEQELKLLYKFRGVRWIAKDRDGKVFAYDMEPIQDSEEWFVDSESNEPRFECLIQEWDCVAWIDEDPIEIKRLLEKGVRNGS